MFLEEHERAGLQDVVSHVNYKMLLKLAQELKKKIGTTPIVSTTEWDYLRMSIEKETKISFVDEFLQLVEDEADGKE